MGNHPLTVRSLKNALWWPKKKNKHYQRFGFIIANVNTKCTAVYSRPQFGSRTGKAHNVSIMKSLAPKNKQKQKQFFPRNISLNRSYQQHMATNLNHRAISREMAR